MRAAIVVIACAVAVALLGDAVNANAIEVGQRCAGEAQLGNIPMKELFRHGGEPNKNMKCFVACMAREDGVLVHGRFDKDKIFSMLPADMPNRDKAVEVLAKCSDQRGHDDCETAYLGAKCLKEHRIPTPFLPEEYEN